jgi:DNA anti-recombination protein RmuC
MSNDNKNAGSNLNEISTIRNILMGEQISGFENSIDSLESKLAELRSHFESRLTEIKKNYDARIAEMEKVHESNVKDLQKEIAEKNHYLEQKINDGDKNNKERLSKLFSMLGQQIING